MSNYRKNCESNIKEKKLKERFRNKFTSYDIYSDYYSGEISYYECERFPNEKDNHYRCDLRVMQEKRKTESDIEYIREFDFKIKLRIKRKNSLPDCRDGVKSLKDGKSWKSISKRKKQWFK